MGNGDRCLALCLQHELGQVWLKGVAFGSSHPWVDSTGIH